MTACTGVQVWRGLLHRTCDRLFRLLLIPMIGSFSLYIGSHPVQKRSVGHTGSGSALTDEWHRYLQPWEKERVQ
jgi:hypothetical protein